MQVLRRLKRIQRIGKMILDTDRIEELGVDLQQQMELAAIYRELIDNTMNVHDMMAGHKLNRVMKMLTSISLLVSIPTLIASLYGMNVGLPLENDPLAFVWVVIFSMLISTPILFILKSKNLI